MARPQLRKTNGDGPSPPRPLGQRKSQIVAAPSIAILGRTSRVGWYNRHVTFGTTKGLR
jgi:hypothetical protein